MLVPKYTKLKVVCLLCLFNTKMQQTVKHTTNTKKVDNNTKTRDTQQQKIKKSSAVILPTIKPTVLQLTHHLDYQHAIVHQAIRRQLHNP